MVKEARRGQEQDRSRESDDLVQREFLPSVVHTLLRARFRGSLRSTQCKYVPSSEASSQPAERSAYARVHLHEFACMKVTLAMRDQK